MTPDDLKAIIFRVYSRVCERIPGLELQVEDGSGNTYIFDHATKKAFPVLTIYDPDKDSYLGYRCASLKTVPEILRFFISPSVTGPTDKRN